MLILGKNSQKSQDLTSEKEHEKYFKMSFAMTYAFGTYQDISTYYIISEMILMSTYNIS